MIATHDRSLYQEGGHRVIELRFGRLHRPEDAVAEVAENEVDAPESTPVEEV